MYFIGHKNPDTDTVCSAISAARLLGGTPAVTENINKETKFILNYFNIETPEILENIAGKKVFILDHNQTTQAPNGYEKASIMGIWDHHTVDGAMYVPGKPIEIIIKPWGSTCSIIANEYFKKGKEIDKQTAGIMLSAILSDTLCFQSPTTTDKDKELAEKLQPIAEIDDLKEFSKKMFKAKSDISELSTKEILNLDYKEFQMGDKKLGIGVAETVEPEMIKKRKQEFLDEMKKQHQELNLDYIFFLPIDVLNSHSSIFIIDENHAQIAQKVFGGEVIDNELDSGNRISRKKQIVPPLQEYFK